MSGNVPHREKLESGQCAVSFRDNVPQRDIYIYVTTVTILAQGTNWADAVSQIYMARVRIQGGNGAKGREATSHEMIRTCANCAHWCTNTNEKRESENGE